MKTCIREPAGHDPALVQQYAEVVDDLPPSEVNQDRILINAYHRYLAHKEAGKSTIKVKITTTKNEQEVYLLSVERNARHGKQYTREEKRHNAIRVYDADVDRAMIQRYLAVSAATLSGWFQHKEKIKRENRRNR